MTKETKKPETKKYYVKKGVMHVNGKKYKEQPETVELTKAEALYDLSQGRISEKPFSKTPAPDAKPSGQKQAADSYGQPATDAKADTK